MHYTPDPLMSGFCRGKGQGNIVSARGCGHVKETVSRYNREEELTMTAYTRLAKSQARQNSSQSKQWVFGLRQKKMIKEYIRENIRDHDWRNVAEWWRPYHFFLFILLIYFEFHMKKSNIRVPK